LTVVNADRAALLTVVNTHCAVLLTVVNAHRTVLLTTVNAGLAALFDRAAGLIAGLAMKRPSGLAQPRQARAWGCARVIFVGIAPEP